MIDSLPMEAKNTLQTQLQRSFGQTVACCLLEENQPFIIHWKSSNFDILFHRNQSLFQEHSFLQYLLDEDQILFENTLHSMKSKDPNSDSFLILSMNSKDSPSSLFLYDSFIFLLRKQNQKRSFSLLLQMMPSINLPIHSITFHRTIDTFQNKRSLQTKHHI